MDRAERERVERRKRNAELEAHLLRHGTDPEVARRLAEMSEPDDEVEVGETEATLVPAPKPPTAPGLSERWAKVVKVVKPTPGRVEATLARRPKKPPTD